MSTNLAGSGTSHEQSGAVARLLARMIHPGTTTHGGTETELEWLRARQGRVTATMARELVRGGPSVRRRIIEESFEPPAPIVGNRYIDRGHEREPVIAAWVRSRFGIEPNQALLAAEQNNRHACTPDGVGMQFEELTLSADLVLAEIKTSKYDLDPTLARGHYSTTGYLEQMQWQLYVTGATRCLFVWEQHDDDWEHGPNPLDLEPRFVWIERDDALIERMVAAADLMLAERDRIIAEQAAGGTGEQEVDVELLGEAIAYLAALEQEKTATARKQAPWQRMLGLLAKRPEFSTKTALAQISWTNTVVVSTVPDEDAALAAEIETAEGDVLHGADYLAHVRECEAALAASPQAANLAAARGVWETHLAQHTKEVRTSKQGLRVTAPKQAKGNDR